MNLTRRSFATLLGLGGTTGIAACQRRRTDDDKPTDEQADDQVEEVPEEPELNLDEFESLALDMEAWNYDEFGDCYYQLGLPYCLHPGSEQYESLSIFVPGAYFTAEKHGQTYSCEVSEEATVSDYTARTAPIALPINSLTFGSQECPITYAYEGLARYLKAGLVYIYAGFRGRSGGYESTTQEYFSGGAPWTLADLKAAIRFIRYNAEVLPGNTDAIFAFGQGGGGGIAATLGTSGNAPVLDAYLEELGAATHDAKGNDLTDDICGAALWCPLSSLGAADAAYEWTMGQYVSDGTRDPKTWTKLLSDDLAVAYGDYINGLGLVDEDGTALSLEQIDDGTYGGGSYYTKLLNVVSEAASDFLSRTEFPYTELPALSEERYFLGDSSLRSLDSAEASDTLSSETEDAVAPATKGVRRVEATVYETLESYVATLNGNNRWLTYNANRGIADLTGLWDFASVCRSATAGVCAYDLLDRSGFANQLFGTDEETSLHFDAIAAGLIERNHNQYASAEDWNEDLVAEFRGDLVETDALDRTVTERVEMVDPLSYVLKGEGALEGTVAPHWRINTGLFQSETTLSGELNLALALQAHKDVADVAFEAVWGAGFGLVERSGDAEGNLIAWIAASMPQKAERSDGQNSGDDAEEESSTDDDGKENS